MPALEQHSDLPRLSTQGAALAVLCALAGSGCLAPPEEAPPPGTEEPPEEVTASSPKDFWWQPDLAPAMPPTFFRFTPNGGLLALADAAENPLLVHAARDGERLADDGPRLLSVDDDWYVGAVSSPTGLAVRTVVTGELVREIEAPVDAGLLAAALSPSGGRLASAWCDSEGRASLVVHRVASGLEEERHPLGEATWCAAGVALMAPWRLAFVGEETVVLADPGGSGVWAWNEAGAGCFGPASVDTIEDPLELVEALDLAVHPEGTEIVVTTRAGELHRLHVPDLEPVGEPLRVGVADVEWSPYMWPTPSSPVAFRPDGAALLVLDEAARPTLVNAKTGERLAELVLPDDDEPDPFLRNAPRPLAFAFSPSGERAAMASNAGTGSWQLDAVEVASPPPLPIVLDGPAQAAVGEPTTFVATHLSGRAPHTHRFVIDGAPVLSGGWGRELTVSFEAAGEVSVVVVVDDGVALGQARLTVQVE